MTADTLIRCKCKQPMEANGTCSHCDQGACSTTHGGVLPGDDAGPACLPKHNTKTCARCVTLAEWEPWEGYNENPPKPEPKEG